MQIESEKSDNKFQQSFMNSTAELTERLGKDIDKYRTRLSFSFKPCESPRCISSAPESPRDSPQKVRTFSMARMTSRDYHHDVSHKPVQD